MIVFDAVHKSFATQNRAVTVLDDLSFTIEKGSTFGIAGLSGQGKSTILRMINGLERPDYGSVTVEGKPVSMCNHQQLRDLRRNIGVVFQDYNLLSNLSVEDNVGLPLKWHRDGDHMTSYEAMSLVGITELGKMYPRQLSGGQKQKVALARALVMKPKILLCDEITSALDDFSAEQLLSTIKAIQIQTRMTVVFVSHKIHDLIYFCDVISVLDGGKLTQVYRSQEKSERKSKVSTYIDYVLEQIS